MSLIVRRPMSLGSRLTVYLLRAVLIVTGLDLFFSLRRTRADLLLDVHRELSSISRTLRVTLEKAGDDTPERYFADISPEVSSFANILGVVCYVPDGLPAFTSVPGDALHPSSGLTSQGSKDEKPDAPPPMSESPSKKIE
jgi:hypothetical protein